MEISRKAILERTHYGLNIYSHVLKQYYPGTTVLSLAGRDCKPAKNPFNQSKLTLWIKILDGCAIHVDTERAIENGNAFDFAAMHYKQDGEKLNEILNREMHLRIDSGTHSIYDWRTKENKEPENLIEEKVSTPVFSFFSKPVTNVHPIGDKSLLEVYQLILGETYKARTKNLRAIKEVKEARKIKAFNFDYATFSGSFTKRNDKNLKQHSGLLTIDFDHLEDLPSLRDKLLNDKYFETELLFVSPSGDGLKWIVSIDLDKCSHQDWFKAIANYLQSTYELEVDQSGKDISRACFLPHDPNVFINPKYVGK